MAARLPVPNRKGPQPVIDETRFRPNTAAQFRALYQALLDVGVPVSQARGVAAWAMLSPVRRADDPTSDRVRAEYRRLLLKLGSPPWESDEATGADISSPAEIAA